MEYTDEELDDLRRLRDLRQQLRAMAEETVAAMKDLPKPETWADAGRKLRTLATADKLVTGMFSPPRRTRKAEISPPKPRPTKPEPSPFMKSMDDIERSLKQIVGAKKALDEAPGDLEVTQPLADALNEISRPSPGPDAPLDAQTIAMAQFNKQLAIASAVSRLKAAGFDATPLEPAKPPP